MAWLLQVRGMWESDDAVSMAEMGAAAIGCGILGYGS